MKMIFYYFIVVEVVVNALLKELLVAVGNKGEN